MKKVILILIVVVLVALQVFLPRYTAQQLKNSLIEEVDDYQALQINVDSWPSLKLLVKAADKVQIRAETITIDQLRLTDLRAEFKNLQLQEKNGAWQAVQGANTELQMLITEADLNNYLRAQEELDIFEKVKLDITPQQVILNGVISIFNAQVRLQLTGEFTVIKDKKIIFASDKLAVENFLISTSSIEQLKEKLQFELDLTELPLPLDVREVELAKDQLKIKGPNNSENN